MLSDRDLSTALDVALAATADAGAVGLRHHCRLDRVDSKADGSPVTVADREAEASIVARIRRAFPSHGILGEESGAGGPAGSPSRWILDPIDGTRGFARGGAHWGPLVALEHEGEVVVAAMALPVLGRTYSAVRGRGCRRDGVPCRVGGKATWGEATASLGELVRLLRSPRAGAVTELVRTAACARAYGDLAACAMLLDGLADAWIEGGVSVWDLAAPKLLVEEAGGVFTDFEGRATPETGDAIAASPGLHAHALAVLRGCRPARVSRPRRRARRRTAPRSGPPRRDPPPSPRRA